MSRYDGRHNAGRMAARRIRREAAMRVYHYRVRDGQPVVWREDAGRLKLLAPVERTAPPEAVAVEVLADAIGRRRAWPLAGDFAAWLAERGPRWDLREGDIWVWVAGRTDGPARA